MYSFEPIVHDKKSPSNRVSFDSQARSIVFERGGGGQTQKILTGKKRLLPKILTTQKFNLSRGNVNICIMSRAYR